MFPSGVSSNKKAEVPSRKILRRSNINILFIPSNNQGFIFPRLRCCSNLRMHFNNISHSPSFTNTIAYAYETHIAQSHLFLEHRYAMDFIHHDIAYNSLFTFLRKINQQTNIINYLYDQIVFSKATIDKWLLKQFHQKFILK